jgi:hypothetical protein
VGHTLIDVLAGIFFTVYTQHPEETNVSTYLVLNPVPFWVTVLSKFHSPSLEPGSVPSLKPSFDQSNAPRYVAGLEPSSIPSSNWYQSLYTFFIYFFWKLYLHFFLETGLYEPDEKNISLYECDDWHKREEGGWKVGRKSSEGGGGVNDRGKRSGKFKKKIITNKTKSSRTSQKLQLLVPPLEVLYAGM